MVSCCKAFVRIHYFLPSRFLYLDFLVFRLYFLFFSVLVLIAPAGFGLYF